LWKGEDFDSFVEGRKKISAFTVAEGVSFFFAVGNGLVYSA
jgi:hypothetical protein